MDQMDMFTRAGDSIVPPTREEIARQRAGRGIESSARHSDDVRPNWTSVGVQYVRAYARHHDLFMAEHVREFAEGQRFPKAPDARAWGKIMRQAARDKIIISHGFAPSNSSNRSPKVLWRSLVRP